MKKIDNLTNILIYTLIKLKLIIPLMKFKPILIVPGQPKSIFFEIFFKTIKNKNFKSPIILISSIKLLNKEMKKFNFKKKLKY